MRLNFTLERDIEKNVLGGFYIRKFKKAGLNEAAFFLSLFRRETIPQAKDFFAE
jgi:hypothetical protein